MPISLVNVIAHYLYGFDPEITQSQTTEIQQSQQKLSLYLDLYLSLSLLVALITAIWFHKGTWLILGLAVIVTIVFVGRWIVSLIRDLTPATPIKRAWRYTLRRLLCSTIFIFFISPFVYTIFDIGWRNQDFWPNIFNNLDRSILVAIVWIFLNLLTSLRHAFKKRATKRAN